MDTDIKKKNLYLSIWGKPKSTFQKIFANPNKNDVIILLVLGGVANSIDNIELGSDDNMRVFGRLSIAVIVGALLGWIGYYIYAWAMSAAGEWLGGRASSSQFRTVVA